MFIIHLKAKTMSSFRLPTLFVLFVMLMLLVVAGTFAPKEPVTANDWRAQLFQERANRPLVEPDAQAFTPCVSGFAGSYPCQNVDLLAFMPISSIGGGEGSSIWGWTDPDTGREYAIMGRTNGTAFVDITDPINPIYLADLPTETFSSFWREMKTYGYYAYIVADNVGGHGVQIFDLRRLRNISNPPVTFEADAVYTGVGSVHTIAIEPSRPYAYLLGSDECGGNIYTIRLTPPTFPNFAGCRDVSYTHDAQCVIYRGPDAEHAGKEICVAADGGSGRLATVDMSNKIDPVDLSRKPYSNAAYSHQGWFTENQEYLVLDDELDELTYGFNTSTYIWDMRDLDDIVMIGTYESTVPAIDHNQFVRDYYTFQSNYTSGLRILDLSQIANSSLTQVAYFDTHPANDNPSFEGTWGNYPYFASRNVIVSNDTGLFILQPNLPLEYAANLDSSQQAAQPGQIITHHLTLHNLRAADSYNLAITGNSFPTVLFTQSPLSVLTDDTASIQVNVMVPGQLTLNSPITETFILSATSLTTGNSYTATGTTLLDVQPALELTPPNSTLNGQPATTVNHIFTLTNAGNSSDDFTFQLTGHNWNTTLSANEINLDAGNTATLTVTVAIPDTFPDTVLLGSDTFTLTATSALDSNITAQVSGQTNAIAEVALAVTGNLTQTGYIGQEQLYELQLTNLGNYTDTFTLEIAGNYWLTTADTMTITNLPAGESTILQITVLVGQEPSDTATLTFTSTLDPQTTAILTLTTYSHPPILYLPLLLRH